MYKWMATVGLFQTVNIVKNHWQKDTVGIQSYGMNAMCRYSKNKFPCILTNIGIEFGFILGILCKQFFPVQP